MVWDGCTCGGNAPLCSRCSVKAIGTRPIAPRTGSRPGPELLAPSLQDRRHQAARRRPTLMGRLRAATHAFREAA